MHCGLYCALPCDKFTLRLQKVLNPLSKIFFPQNKYHLKKIEFYYTRNVCTVLSTVMDVRIFDVQLLAEYDVQWSRKTFFGNNFKIHDIYTKSYQCQSNSFPPALNAILYKSISNYKPNYIDHCLLSIKIFVVYRVSHLT